MVALCWRPASDYSSDEKIRIDELRSELATLLGLWPTRIGACTEKVLLACNCEATLASVFGASNDGATLMALSSCGSESTAVAAGRLFPTPWKTPSTGTDYRGSSSARLSRASHLKSLAQSLPKTLTWKSGSELVLPFEWHQILGQMRFSETMALQATLEPLVLNRRLVGALLVVSCAGVLPQYRHSREVVTTAPFVSPVTWTGGDRSDSPPATPKGSPSSLLRRLKMRKSSGGYSKSNAAAPTPELMRDMASALAQSAFAPRLQPIARVCSAAQALASALTLSEFASILTYTVTDALAAELHVNLAVRVAVVPPMYGQCGYLLPLDTTALELAGNSDSMFKRTPSGALANVTLPRMPSLVRTLSGRGCSFSGQSPASAPNNIMSAPSGVAVKTDGKATPFVLPSSLLMQLLRPTANRGGNASVHGSIHAGSYFPEEPTVRSIVTRTAPPQAPDAAQQSDGLPQDVNSICNAQAALAGAASAARESQLQLHPSGCSASGGAAARAGAGAGASGISGMVIANLNAWMQDVEKPSSDVAQLLMSKCRTATTAAPGRMSFGGGGGIAAGPACLVVVAGSTHRAGVVASAANVAAATASGSIHVARSSKPGFPIEDWVKSLEASMRGGVAVDMSFRAGGYGGGGGGGYGSVYGGGSVRYDGGLSCGPCVALYITASERLPTSLLRAVKERSQGLLELLLTSCLSSLSMGPVRADLEALANLATFVAAANGVQGGPPSSRRNILAAAVAAAPSSVGLPTPLASSHGTSGSHQHLNHMPSPPASVAEEPTAAALPLRFSVGLAPTGDGGGGGATMLSSPSPRATGGGGGGCSGCSGTLDLSRVRSGNDAGGCSGNSCPGNGNSGNSMPNLGLGPTDRTSPVRSNEAGGAGGGSSSSRQGEICLLAQQKWPDRTTTSAAQSAAAMASPLPSSGAVSGRTATGGRASPLAAHLSSQSRTTRGTPGSGESSGFGPMASIMASMDVVSGADDLVTSMRDNLDVWVNSFWGMLRESTANGGGHTSGSYADDDLRFLRLYSRLGSGGAASVYAGMLLGMDVAVKVIHPPPEFDMDALAAARGSSALVGSLVPTTGSRVQQPGATFEGPVGAAAAAEDGEGSEGTGGEAERVVALATALRQAQMRELMRSARECAVLTTLSHPAIVQVYSYHTRVQVLPGDGPDALPRLLTVPPGEPAESVEGPGPLHSVLVMERCDLGSLADALDSGMFKKAILAAANAAVSPGCSSASLRTGNGRSSSNSTAGQAAGRGEFGSGGGGSFSFSSSCGGVAMRAIYLTLLEVALALRHLHSKNLVHCDVKVANVLLKSSASDPRGFTCKLSDFGLVNLLQLDEEPESEEEGQEGGATQAGPRAALKPWMRNADAAGTVTHLAPECFTPGAKLDQSVDIYAFGIVMWEVFTRKAPYAEFAPDFEGLPTRVLAGLRPRFPSHSPAPFKALAQACWCSDAARRPTAASVVSCLQQLLEGGHPYNRPT